MTTIYRSLQITIESKVGQGSDTNARVGRFKLGSNRYLV